jgi:hypothetical protein
MISVVRDYDWPQLRVYANSLERCSLKARKVMLFDNLTTEALDNLYTRGFDLVHVDMPNTFPRFNYRSRQAAAVAFLRERGYEQYRFILWSGIRDHIFQSDPFMWLEKYLGADTERIVGAGEGWLIKNEPSNTRWIESTVPPSSWATLAEHEVLCSDTIAGAASLVYHVLKVTADMVVDTKVGVDQAAANYAMYELCGDKLMIPAMNDGFTATWYPEKSANPAKLIGYDTVDEWKTWYLRFGTPHFNVRDGIVYTPDKKTPFSMVHQYDRCSVWKEMMEMKYAD